MLNIILFVLALGCCALGEQTIPKIVDGKIVKASVYPWIASLYLYGECGDAYLRLAHFCGGSIFDVETRDRTWLLTAAHCLEGVESMIESYDDMYSNYHCVFKLYADITRDDADDMSESGFETIEIQAYKLHNKYATDPTRNDIAVAWSKDPVSIDPVKLQSATPCCDSQDQVRVIGYGADTENGVPTATLEYVDLHYVEPDTCEEMLDTYAFNDDHLRDGMFCAYDRYQDACQGDSGGPMIQGTTKRSKQVGVVSWGYGCARTGVPGIYTDVGYFYDWIQKTKDNTNLEGGGSVASFLVAIAVALFTAALY